MGLFRYGATGVVIKTDDFYLGHLRAVFFTKMRRSEGFLLSGETENGNPVTVWIHPSIPATFEFDSTLRVVLDRRVLSRMIESTYQNAGLSVGALAADELDLLGLLSDRTGEPVAESRQKVAT